MKEDVISILNRARAAHKSGDYPAALSGHERFFDLALEYSPSLYGVRLSYCLLDWAQLGHVYPAAQQRLLDRRDDSLSRLLEGGEPRLFHDYVAICRSLGNTQLAVTAFEAIHRDNRSLAEQIVAFIWGELVASKRWQICSCYLPDPYGKYEDCVYKYQLIVDYQAAATERELKVMARFQARLHQEVLGVLLVIKHSEKTEAFESLLARMMADLQDKNLIQLACDIEAALKA